MKNPDFPEKTFIEGLKVTKKVKASMKPFIDQFSKLNLPYIFESFRILITNLTDSSIEPLIKMNSLFAFKCILDSCEYVPITMLEAYALPFIVQGAGYKPNEDEDKRGSDFFLKMPHQEKDVEAFGNYGFNYVKLAYEILYVSAIIKPRSLYFNEETKDPSRFAFQFKVTSKSLKQPPGQLQFFKQAPENLRKKFVQNLKKFDQKQSEAYSQYVESVFLEQVKQNFNNNYLLDIRELYKTGDFFICEDSLQLTNQLVQKGKTMKNVSAGIQYISQMIRAGVLQVWMWSHDNQIIKYLVHSIDQIQDQGDMSLLRGQKFLNDKKGTPEQKKQVYIEFLTALEFWANSFIKNSIFDPSKESNIRKYYKFLREDRGYEFPNDPLLKKLLSEAEENFNLFKIRNKMVLLDLKQSGQLEEQKQDPILKSKRKIDSKKEISQEKIQSKKSVEPSQTSAKKLQNDNSMGSVKGPSNKQIPKMQESTKKIEEPKNIPSNSQLKPNTSNQNLETPEGDESLSEHSVRNGEAFKNRLDQVEKILEKLKKSQKNLPKNMDYIMNQKELLEKNLQTAQINDDELEDIMGRYFDIAEVIEKIEPSYSKYKRNQINFQTFCRSFNTGKTRKNSSTNLMNEKKNDQKINVDSLNEKIEEKNRSNKSIESNLKVQSQKNIDQSVSRKSIPQQQNDQSLSKNSNNKQESKKIISQQKMEKQESKKSIVEEKESKKNIQQESLKIIRNEEQAFKKKQGYKMSEDPSFVNVEKERFESLQQSKPEMQEKQINTNKSIHLQVEREEKIEFQNSNFSQSRLSHKKYEQLKQYDLNKEKVVQSQVISNSSLRVNTIQEEEIQIEEEVAIKVKSFRKFNDPPLNQRRNQVMQESNQIQAPVTNAIKNEEAQKKSEKMDKSLYDEIKSEAAHKSEVSKSQIRVPEDLKDRGVPELEPEYLDDDEIIESPSLNPLDNSFHEDDEYYAEKLKKKPKISFKDAISNNDYIMKGTKKQNLFWLKSQAQSIIKPAYNNQKRSRVQSTISVPELLEEKNKKYQSDIRYVEESKDRQIKQLENKLMRAENEKATIREQLKIRQNQIRSYQELSQPGDRSRLNIEQVNYIEDQNYVMKKLSAAAGMNNSSISHSYRKRDFQKASNFQNLTSSCKMVNTKKFNDYFKNFTKEKEKKMHLKNKELLYKDNEIEVGCMGYREGNLYRITCYLTPENDMVLVKIGVENDDNLEIKHEVSPNIKISRRCQEKLHFSINVVNVPYHIPYIYLHYIISGEDKKTRVFLPCAFHKFFKIQPNNQSYFNDQFQNNSGFVQRGQEIPYSKRALKNLDNLLDYLPHISKLNKGNTDHHGQICFGGNAMYKKSCFAIKICIKPNQFLYIKALNEKRGEEEQLMLDFYIATLNHLLMKDISWD